MKKLDRICYSERELDLLEESGLGRDPKIIADVPFRFAIFDDSGKFESAEISAIGDLIIGERSDDRPATVMFSDRTGNCHFAYDPAADKWFLTDEDGDLVQSLIVQIDWPEE